MIGILRYQRRYPGELRIEQNRMCQSDFEFLRYLHAEHAGHFVPGGFENVQLTIIYFLLNLFQSTNLKGNKSSYELDETYSI